MNIRSITLSKRQSETLNILPCWINQLLKSIDRDRALQGIGKPEPLKYNKSGLYSRRIDEENRLVYELSDNHIIVKSCRGHYED